MNLKYFLILTVLYSFSSCEDVQLETTQIQNEKRPSLKRGSADFSKYVALGASFTSGYTDGALFKEAQKNSFPNILSKKFAMIGGGTFTQPLMNDNYGGLLLSNNRIGEPRLVIGTNNFPTPLEDVIGMTVPVSTDIAVNNPTGPFNNLGVPGAKSFHLLAPSYGNLTGVTLGTANPYFVRMASSATATILEDAVAQNPTFFTISEIGGNDILDYALSGGTGTDQTGNSDPSTYTKGDITDPGLFAQTFTTIVNSLTSAGAKGAVGTLPYVTSLSFFNTVNYNDAPLDEPTSQSLNAAYNDYNLGLQRALSLDLILEEEATERTITFSEGQNSVVIIDEYLTDLGALNPTFSSLPKYRQAKADDLLILTSSSIIGKVNSENVALLVTGGASQAEASQASINGLTFPLADKWVLTSEEQEIIKNAIDAYNVTIEMVATAKNLALVDFKSILDDASDNGIEFDNYNLTTDLILGGLISLDGIHMTARGYALMANKFLEAIDDAYGSNFVEAGLLSKAADYPTNYSPSLP